MGERNFSPEDLVRGLCILPALQCNCSYLQPKKLKGKLRVGAKESPLANKYVTGCKKT
tara:strand:- start:885 stop:1058 length:174 start_codon:yes stop_codon:yes gene_type:complete